LEILSSKAYETISMQKMRDQIAKELCAQSGVEYAKNDLPEEIAAAVDVWLNSLVPSHQNEITYYF